MSVYDECEKMGEQEREEEVKLTERRGEERARQRGIRGEGKMKGSKESKREVKKREGA